MYSIQEVKLFRNKYGKKRLILDTNLFLLVFSGLCDKTKIHESYATKKYCDKDYEILLDVIRYFDAEFVVTPHVLAEISNLSRQAKNISDRKQWYYFNLMVEKLKQCKEETLELNDILAFETKLLIQFGVTDLSLIEIARSRDAVVITADIPLAQLAHSKMVPCIQFETLRTQELLPL